MHKQGYKQKGSYRQKGEIIKIHTRLYTSETKKPWLGCMFIYKRRGYFGVDRTRTSPDPGEGNRERSGSILDRHKARNPECHTDSRKCIVRPTSIRTGKQNEHPGWALDHLLVPAWAREEAPENDAKYFVSQSYLSHHAQTEPHIHFPWIDESWRSDQA